MPALTKYSPDTNNIIILYPQAEVDYTYEVTWDSGILDNPYACFDWIGWYGENADQHGGKSVRNFLFYVSYEM